MEVAKSGCEFASARLQRLPQTIQDMTAIEPLTVFRDSIRSNKSPADTGTRVQRSSYTSVVCIHGLYFYSTAIGSPWDPCAFFALALFFFSSSYLYHSSLRS